ncbi:MULTISPECIES: RDD family protein [unclassified Virgibacillus]|uniref:RDD family protein n=1 Tax=unclassified Virgibacillus TaxID=2620237 RepID=UPI0024DE180C|nr:RDD family protein [Virgibacillus sp. LDC-1]
MKEEINATYEIEDTLPVHLRYAGFWMRFWAYMADLIIVFSITGIVLLPLHFIGTGGSPISIGYWTVNGIISIGVLYLYFLLMTKYFSQTLGKMIFGIKVIRKDLEPLTWSDLIFREIIGRFFYRVFTIAGLLYIVVAFDDRKRGIHDMIGDTSVIHER